MCFVSPSLPHLPKGMFGQRAKWNLYDRTTWCPKNEDPSLGYLAVRTRTTTEEEDRQEQLKRKQIEEERKTANLLNNVGNIRLSKAMQQRMQRPTVVKGTNKQATSLTAPLVKSESGSGSVVGSGNNISNGDVLFSDSFVDAGIQFSVRKETARLPNWVPRKPKRESKLSDGWENKIGRQTTDIWMRLGTHQVVNVPKDRKKWMHQSHKRKIVKDE